MKRVLLIAVLLLSTFAAEAANKYDARREKAYRTRVARFMTLQARKQQLAARTTHQVKSHNQE